MVATLDINDNENVNSQWQKLKSTLIEEGDKNLKALKTVTKKS